MSAAIRRRLFISYRRKAWLFAHPLHEKLTGLLDADIFIDYRDIDEPEFENAILRALRGCDAVLLVVSEHTFSERIFEEKDWVRREIAEALNHKKPIVMACIDGLFPPTKLPPDIAAISGREGVRFFPEYFDHGIERLANFMERATPIRRVPKSILASEAPIAPPATSGLNLVAEAEKAVELGDFGRAVILLEEAKQKGDPLNSNVETLLRDQRAKRDQIAAAQRAAFEYARLVDVCALAQSPDALAELRRSWLTFQAEFPNFKQDTANFAERVKAAAPPPTAIQAMFAPWKHTIPTHGAQIAILLDPQHYTPPERLRAGEALAKIGDVRSGVDVRRDGTPDITFCHVPAGVVSFNERRARLPEFWVGKYLVTNAQFEAFMRAGDGFDNAQWWSKPFPLIYPIGARVGSREWKGGNFPVQYISWGAAVAFCRWLGARLNVKIHLPGGQQWLRAMRGESIANAPWGGYKTGFANVDEIADNSGAQRLGQPSPVGMYPQGVAFCGALDMIGNLWEMTEETVADARLASLKADSAVRIRGGAWNSPSAQRLGTHTITRLDHAVGFRVVADQLPAPYPLKGTGALSSR